MRLTPARAREMKGSFPCVRYHPVMEAWRSMSEKGEGYYTLIEQLLSFIEPVRRLESEHPGKLSVGHTILIHWVADSLAECLELQSLPDESDQARREEIQWRMATGWRVLRNVLSDDDLVKALNGPRESKRSHRSRVSISGHLLTQDLGLIELICRQAMRPIPELLPALEKLRNWVATADRLSGKMIPLNDEVLTANAVVRAAMEALVNAPPPLSFLRVNFGLAFGAVDVIALNQRYGISRVHRIRMTRFDRDLLDCSEKVPYPDALRICLSNFLADACRYGAERGMKLV